MQKKLMLTMLVVSIILTLFTGTSFSYASDGASAYVVKSGDTLCNISKQYGVSVSELAKYNKIKNPDLIYIGQIISIPQKEPDYSAMYMNAVKDAVIAEENEKSNHLIAVSKDNSYIKWDDKKEKVLVVTWTKYASSYLNKSEVTTSWGDVWVTVVPELLDWYRNSKQSFKDKVLRTEQLLGLPKGSGDTNFVELWVSPSDLFRPAPDNEIDDSTVNMDFPPDTSKDYIGWFDNQIIYSYFPLKYPWTRLGYTYDWGNPGNEVGLSEFIIKKGSNVLVKAVYSNEDYLGMTTVH